MLDKESIVKLPRVKKEEENKKLCVPSGVPCDDGHHLSAGGCGNTHSKHAGHEMGGCSEHAH